MAARNLYPSSSSEESDSEAAQYSTSYSRPSSRNPFLSGTTGSGYSAVGQLPVKRKQKALKSFTGLEPAKPSYRDYSRPAKVLKKGSGSSYDSRSSPPEAKKHKMSTVQRSQYVLKSLSKQLALRQDEESDEESPYKTPEHTYSAPQHTTTYAHSEFSLPAHSQKRDSRQQSLVPHAESSSPAHSQKRDSRQQSLVPHAESSSPARSQRSDPGLRSLFPCSESSSPSHPQRREQGSGSEQGPGSFLPQHCVNTAIITEALRDTMSLVFPERADEWSDDWGYTVADIIIKRKQMAAQRHCSSAYEDGSGTSTACQPDVSSIPHSQDEESDEESPYKTPSEHTYSAPQHTTTYAGKGKTPHSARHSGSAHSSRQQGESSSGRSGKQSGSTAKRVVALDCEMVGCQPDAKWLARLSAARRKGKRKKLPSEVSVAGRCTIVDYNGKVLYDSHIRPNLEIITLRTCISGITYRDLNDATPFDEARQEVMDLLRDRLVVAHDIKHDLSSLQLSLRPESIRDTSTCTPLRKLAGVPLSHPHAALRKLAKNVLGRDVQTELPHSSLKDARVAMELYRAVEEEWEREEEVDTGW